MSSINDDLYDLSIGHASMVRGFENSMQTDVKRIIARHKNRLRKGLAAIKNAGSKSARTTVLEPENKRFIKEMKSSMTTQLKDLSLVETDFNSNMLNKKLGKFANIKRPPASTTLTAIVGSNIRGDKSLTKYITSLGDDELLRINMALKKGIAEGATQKQLISSVIGKTKLTEAQASALVRTGITRTQSIAQLNTFKGNEELLKGVRFTAVLDSKTSPICSHHDGMVYDLNDTRFTPPLHWRCRSTLIPVVKSHSELLASSSKEVKQNVLTNMSEQGIAQLNGASPNKENYGTWLKRQPQDVKLRHLDNSSEKLALFNSGQVAFTSFTNSAGQGVSLQALRRLDNKATAVIPTRQRVSSAVTKQSMAASASTPRSLIRNSSKETELRDLIKADAVDMASPLSLVDFRGTSIVGKKTSRRRANNQFDERNTGVDPLTGETKSTLVYDPDFNVLQERIDYLQNSKTLSLDEKNFIQRFALSLENDGLSVNQQTAVIENLRINFERFARDKKPWENYAAVTRAEMANSVVNTSRILDRRSRARSQQFQFGAGNESTVQILGIHTKFDDIAARTLENQRYVKSWADTTGLQLARRSLLTGRSPLKNYFPTIPSFLPKMPKVRELIYKQIEKLPGGKMLSRKLQGKPNDSLLTEFLRAGNEKIRQILYLEFLYAKKREVYDKASILPSFLKTRERELSKIMKSVATGKSTDYDTLSINIGKQLYENSKNDFDVFFPKPSLQAFHRAGSKILDGLKDQGKIKVSLRGTTRRGVLDLDSGRPETGSFKDTISREVTIVDPSMLALQRASRELVYSRRIGIVNQRDRLYVKAGQKEYVDARGNPTGESVITRKAGANYDTDLVDRDFSNMLNHAMDAEWEVDNDFASFFDDLLHFRDPRGNVAKYDELNGFRKIILTRGDQGSGLMQTVKWHLQRGESFRNPVQIDGRGRVYTTGYLHPAGGELVRPFLNTARKVNFDDDILFELMTQLGAMTGPSQSVLTNAGRIASFQAREKQFRELGELMLSKTQRPRRLREFLEHPLIIATDADHVPKIARFALEYTRVYNHVNGDFSNKKLLRSYQSQLTSENDASASGAQLIALSTRNKKLGEASNVTYTDQKNRLYDTVAEATMSDPEFRKLAVAQDLSFDDMAKAAKGQSMVAFYGAGRSTQGGAIEGKLAKILDKKEYTVLSKSEISNVNKILDSKIKLAVDSDSIAVATALRELKGEIKDIVDNGAPIGNKIITQARDSHPDVEEFVNKLTNVRQGLIGPRQFQEIARIMSKHLAEIAPITEQFVDFWKDVARIYITESGKVDIPWVTVDGKLLYQRYRPTVQERIEFRDPVTGRRISNIYEDTVTDGSLLGKSSIIDARSGLGVNGNHMNDATLVRQFHLWGRRNGIPTGTIHDAFFTNIGDSLRAKTALRQIYADAVEGDTMLKTLEAMRDAGLSEASYRALLKRGTEEGLLNPKDPLTSKDILEKIPPGSDWYGIGP